MISPANYAALYDFTAIESAIQSWFVSTGLFAAPDNNSNPQREKWTPAAGKIAFFTAFQLQIFQKHTPRLGTHLSGVNPISKVGHGVVDGNGAIRNNLWTGSLMLEVITEEDYAAHTALRAKAMAISEMIAPMVSDPTILLGANQFLSNQLINYCAPQNMDTNIQRGDGFYGSQLHYNLTFGIPPAAITGVTG